MIQHINLNVTNIMCSNQNCHFCIKSENKYNFSWNILIVMQMICSSNDSLNDFKKRAHSLHDNLYNMLH